MPPVDLEIAATLERLAHGYFEAELDWGVCYELVRSEVLRRRLPARDFAPSSQFPGASWTADDFTELAGEWVCFIRGGRAVRLVGEGRSIEHIANAARRSVYHFILGKMRATPRKDVLDALSEVLPEFKGLTEGELSHHRVFPDVPFPWRHVRERSAHQRVVTAVEVRAALKVLQTQQPHGWSRESLLRTLITWAGVPEFEKQSMDALLPETLHSQNTSPPYSELIGREVAQSLLKILDESERAILRGFIIPNQLGLVSLEQAASTLGVSKSTLHDRAEKLKHKLASLENDSVTQLDSGALAAFLDEIMREPGNPGARQSTE